MPLYEYCCPSCELKFERLSPASQRDQAECPSCHSLAQRALSTFSCVSKSAEGASLPVGGFNPCGSCSSASCATCH